MTDISSISQYDLYFLVRDAAPLIVAQKNMLHPVVAPRLGTDWVCDLETDAKNYRGAVELVIREGLETTEAIRVVETLAQNISQWRELATGLARNAPPPRRDVLMKAAGWGAGSARTVKEMKDILLTIKSRMALLGDEFRALGMSAELLELPGRVLAQLETGAGDVAREKAEDTIARASVAELYGRVNAGLSAAWRGAELVALQARLLAQRDDAPVGEKAAQKAVADRAGELVVKLEKSLGEARVQARNAAANEVLPPGFAAPADDVASAMAVQSVA